MSDRDLVALQHPGRGVNESRQVHGPSR